MRALLRGLDKWLVDATGLLVRETEDSAHAAIERVGVVTEELAHLSKHSNNGTTALPFCAGEVGASSVWQVCLALSARTWRLCRIAWRVSLRVGRKCLRCNTVFLSSDFSPYFWLSDSRVSLVYHIAIGRHQDERTHAKLRAKMQHTPLTQVRQ